MNHLAQAPSVALLGPADTFTAVMSGAAATTNPVYSLIADNLHNVGSLGGETPVALVTPGGSGLLHVVSLSIYNGDTAAVTVTIKKTDVVLTTITLAVGDTMFLTSDGVTTVNTTGDAEGDSSDVTVGDAVDVALGDSQDVLLRWSTGDASNHAFAIGLGDTNQALHLTDKAAIATDWNVSADTHPTVYYHSNTTPNTDYFKVGAHNGSVAWIADMVGGATLYAGFDGLECLELVETASAVNHVALTNSATGNAADVSAKGDDTDINLQLTPKGAGYVVSNGPFQVRDSVAVEATAGGGTTGLIPAGSSLVVVTSDDADKQISLPAATVGDRIRILVGATGCELISAVVTHKVNDVVVGETNEAALTAENLYDCQYVATDTWVVIGYTKLGAVQAALVPDALA